LFDKFFNPYLNPSLGNILTNLLLRNVEEEEDDDDRVVSDLLNTCDGQGNFYSFCYGRVVNAEETRHCSGCHVCYDYNYWQCVGCGSTEAMQCKKCQPSILRQRCGDCGGLQGLQDEEEAQELASTTTNTSSYLLAKSDDSLQSVSQLNVSSLY
jgi:hypothetical protein